MTTSTNMKGKKGRKKNSGHEVIKLSSHFSPSHNSFHRDDVDSNKWNEIANRRENVYHIIRLLDVSRRQPAQCLAHCISWTASYQRTLNREGKLYEKKPSRKRVQVEMKFLPPLWWESRGFSSNKCWYWITFTFFSYHFCHLLPPPSSLVFQKVTSNIFLSLEYSLYFPRPNTVKRTNDCNIREWMDSIWRE